jgi:ribose transport system ATP-binding protein
VTHPPLLEVLEVSKHFPGVQALDRVSLRLAAGEVLAVVGENGAGKSTLMKILAGIYAPDGGRISWNGQAIRFAGVADALAHGISLIHQELNLAENLSVAANLFLGREACWGGRLRLLGRRRMAQDARALLDRVGLACSPEALVGELPLGQRQLVEIARALSMRARLLIMDEPTSSLTQRETDRLFEVIGELKRAGVAVIYISHRLVEVSRVADRVVVLRDGRNAGELDRTQITHAAMVRLLVGRDLQQFFHRRHRPSPFMPSSEGIGDPGRLETGPTTRGRPLLEIRDARFVGGPECSVSLSVRAGEIVGLAGLVGAGRTELAEALFGLRRITGGQVFLDGKPVHIRLPREAVAAGILLIPEDRRLHGLILEASVQGNIGLPNLDRLNVCRLISPRAEAALARQTCERLRIRTPGLGQVVALLSGGNQQKVVLGKWLARPHRVLIFDEPTRGIDVGAKSEIYALMDQLASDGAAILMISSDLEEILGMSDRVLVLHQGRLAGELDHSQLTEEAVMHLATGGENKQ